VYYLWRPLIRDPKDDMVLELAVASNAEFIVTYNKADFKGSEHFGIKTITPKELLTKIGDIRWAQSAYDFQIHFTEESEK
jgi:predicted nucleic acid-binding protein